MRYRIVKHPQVEQDLFNITDLIASYAGVGTAMDKVDEITGFIDRLADYPKIGTVRDELSPGLRAIPASDKAVVCFTVDDNSLIVYVIAISYAGSDWVTKISERAE